MHRINGGSGIPASSLTDKRVVNIPNPNSTACPEEGEGDGYLDVVLCEENKNKGQNVISEGENEYDDVQNIEGADNNWSLLQRPGQSLVLGEKDMKLFEMSSDQTTASGASSCVAPPPTDTDPECLIVRITEPHPFRHKYQAFSTTDTLPEPHTAKSNPLFQSIGTSSNSTDGSMEKKDTFKEMLDSQQMNSSSDSTINESDFVSADSLPSQT